MNEKTNGGKSSSGKPPTRIRVRYIVARVVQTDPRVVAEPIAEAASEQEAHRLAREAAQTESQLFTITRVTYAGRKMVRIEPDIAAY